jgi:hypothetical protein
MPKIITVHVKADGSLECVPIVTHVRPGGSLIWGGKKHKGVFDGRVDGPVRQQFTLAELQAIHPIAGPMPFQPTTWEVIDESPGAVNPSTVHVDAKAQSGVMYKYSITAGGRTLDPIIIVDDSASEN